MNREIKFRAWCENEKGEKAMLSDMAFLQSNGIISTPVFHHSSNFYIIRKAIMMQYTGLKDKNGKEIYEGDILDSFSGKMQVSFSNGCFSVIDESEHYMLGNCPKDEIEVIGNIYENPELLTPNP